MSIDVDYLREVYAYDPETGEFCWRIGRSGARVGVVAGSLERTGYRRIWLDGRRYLAHRLAWFYVYGRWPAEQIDHIDGDKLNNRIANLREATMQQNNRNKRVQSNNSSGYKGASWDGHLGKWRAYIYVSRRRIYLGLYPSAAEAHRAYCEAAMRHHGEFANVG